MFGSLTGKRQLSVDWDAQSLRVVQFRARAERIEILKALSVPIPAEIRQEDAESLGAFLRQALTQAGIRDRHAGLTIPREKVVLNTLNVPPTPLDELPALVQFQIVKELPFAADQATLDFTVRGTHDPKAPAEVLVAAVRNEALGLYTQVAREAGLQVDRVGLRPHANLIAFTAGSDAARKGLCLAIDVGPNLTEINVMREGGLIFSRSASVRLAFDTEPALEGELLADSKIVGAAVPNLSGGSATVRDAVASLMVEIVRSYEAYRATEAGAKLEQIIVAGATGVEASLAEALHERLGVHAELYNPGATLDLPPQRARELRGFSAAIGLAMCSAMPPTQQFNFLAPKKAVAQSTKRLRRMPRVVMAAAMVILSVLVYRRYVVEPKQKEIARLKDNTSDLKRELDGYRKGKVMIDGVNDVDGRVIAVRDWFDSQFVWTSELAALTRAFPADKEAYVTAVSFSDQPPSIDLALRTMNPSITNGFVTRLTSEGFNAAVGSSSESPMKDGFLYSDSVKISLSPGRRSGAAAPAASQPGGGR